MTEQTVDTIAEPTYPPRWMMLRDRHRCDNRRERALILRHLEERRGELKNKCRDRDEEREHEKPFEARLVNLPAVGKDFTEGQSRRGRQRRRRQIRILLRLVGKNFRKLARPDPAFTVGFADFVFANQPAFPLPVAQFIEVDRTVFLALHTHDPLV